MPEADTDHLDPEIIFNWLGIPEEHQERPLEFFTNMALMEPEDVAELEGRSFDEFEPRTRNHKLRLKRMGINYNQYYIVSLFIRLLQ